MIEYYLPIKLVHVAAVLASGGLFLLRGLGVQLGAAWPQVAPVRMLSYVIDTTLLIAALMLSSMLRQYPFVHGWLTAKVLLLVVYIVLGILALKRGRTKAVRLVSWVSALVVYAMIISIARTHDPLGMLRGLPIL